MSVAERRLKKKVRDRGAPGDADGLIDLFYMAFMGVDDGGWSSVEEFGDAGGCVSFMIELCHQFLADAGYFTEPT